MPNGFKDYDRPSYGFGAQDTRGKDKKFGGFLDIFGPAVIGAIGSYFTARSQMGMEERSWKYRMELERMRIEAEKELERMRNSIDPEIYAQLKRELMRPTTPHGMGAGGKAPTGTYRNLLQNTATPIQQPGGMKQDELNNYFTGGR